jgi:tetratricopeptide (TPR) repeat protein
MYGTGYALESPDAERCYSAAGEFAEKAYILDPYNLFVQLSLVLKCFLFDEKERFFHLADRMLERNPNSTLRLGGLGFYLCLYGDWERGKKILDSVMVGHMEYPRFFHGATMLYYYRNGAYDRALQEAMRYQVPGFFWGPLLRASVLGQLERFSEAQNELEQLKRLKPDFQDKPRYLISRFVKDESLVDHVLRGLQKA